MIIAPGRAQRALRHAPRRGQGPVQLKGFRKGKVPVAHLKKLYGRSLMAEVLQQTVEETSRKAHQGPQRARRASAQHQPDRGQGRDRARALAGKSDLAFTMSYEALPEIKVTDLPALKLEREVADVRREAVDKALGELLERCDPLRGGGRPRGRRRRPRHHRLRRPHRRRGVRGRQGRGRAARGRPVAASFRGSSRASRAPRPARSAPSTSSSPTTTRRRTLAGKDAVFEVKVKEVAKPIRPELNDEFAKTLGAEIARQAAASWSAPRSPANMPPSRACKLKRQILDALDKAHDFALPETLVDGEFDGIWKQLTQSLEQAGKTLCRRGQDRGRAARPSTARSPSGACASAS